MHQLSPHLRGQAGEIAGLMCGAVTFSVTPTVPGKCRACDITQIYPCGIYYYKEQGYDSQQVSRGRAVMDEKSLSPLFPVG